MALRSLLRSCVLAFALASSSLAQTDPATDPATSMGNVQFAPCDGATFDPATFADEDPSWTTVPIDSECHQLPPMEEVTQQGPGMCDFYSNAECSGETSITMMSYEGKCYGTTPGQKWMAVNCWMASNAEEGPVPVGVTSGVGRGALPARIPSTWKFSVRMIGPFRHEIAAQGYGCNRHTL
ncbi:hypothetical protein BDZ85DRAFT_250576 [Elsinoe ampelina]|uniref:Uncharacterized protein n=1 Tax=Elsinoe ampelina TaxID=302913 RepID=A0A6A6GAX5_9PEZI|nr:hypothetical protein BDZ85DRAFT_250576 [Elsinoe ampelina]